MLISHWDVGGVNGHSGLSLKRLKCSSKHKQALQTITHFPNRFCQSRNTYYGLNHCFNHLYMLCKSFLKVRNTKITDSMILEYCRVHSRVNPRGFFLLVRLRAD